MLRVRLVFQEVNVRKLSLYLILTCILSLGANVSMSSASGLESAVKEFSLDNGLQLLVVERPGSPTFSAYITIGVGSVHERSHQRGVAHLLEHMLFKGTKTLGTKDYSQERPLLDQIEKVGSRLDELRLNPGQNDEEIAQLERRLEELQEEYRQWVVKDEFSRIYAENGGVGYNAFTSKDLTTYLINLPSNKLELWAAIESDRMKNPVLREFYTERDVVREERRRSYESSPGGLLYENLIATAFTMHPYRNPIIGWQSDIANLTLAETRDFLHSYYAPINTTIALAGDIDPEQAYRLVEQYFGDIEPGVPVPQVAEQEPPQQGEKRRVIYFDSEPRLAIAYHKPTLPAEEDYVFDVIDEVLGEGRTSRLYRSLVEEQRVATSVSTYMAPGSRYDNLYVINAVPRYPHTVSEVEAAIYNELQRLSEKPVSDSELEKARKQLRTSQLRMLKSNGGLARMLTTLQSIVGDWRYLIDYDARIASVNSETVQNVAARYFVPENRTVVVLGREGEAK